MNDNDASQDTIDIIHNTQLGLTLTEHIQAVLTRQPQKGTTVWMHLGVHKYTYGEATSNHPLWLLEAVQQILSWTSVFPEEMHF